MDDPLEIDQQDDGIQAVNFLNQCKSARLDIHDNRTVDFVRNLLSFRDTTQKTSPKIWYVITESCIGSTTFQPYVEEPV
jgi:hypothetical protein